MECEYPPLDMFQAAFLYNTAVSLALTLQMCYVRELVFFTVILKRRSRSRCLLPSVTLLKHVLAFIR